MSIERNILLRSTVETLIGLAADEGFTEAELLSALHARLPQADVAADELSYDAAVRYERTTAMPYGEFCGAKIGDIAIERLCWYADQRFVDGLRRYLRSPRGRERIEKESDA